MKLSEEMRYIGARFHYSRPGVDGQKICEWADRIEELEAKLRLQKSNAGGAYERIEELEAENKRLQEESADNILELEGAIKFMDEVIDSKDERIEELEATIEKYQTEAKHWTTGLCSAHMIPDPTCGTCNRVVRDLELEIKRLHKMMYDRGQIFKDDAERLADENKRLNELYQDLLFQVSIKHPNESRHETAKRYLANAERSECQSKKEAPHNPSDPDN